MQIYRNVVTEGQVGKVLTLRIWHRVDASSPLGAIGTSLVKMHVFRKRVRKVYQ
jgi:hypothetical protein